MSHRALASLLFLSTLPAFAQPSRINSNPSDGAWTPLPVNVHPLARPGFDRGLAAPASKLPYVTMVFQPAASQQVDLETLLIQQQDKSSPNFHRWLTPAQFGDRFGLSPSDVAVVRSWLVSRGFQVVDTARGRNWIAFSGTVAQVQAAFHTEIHRFEVRGKMHYSNATAPSVPSAFAGLVRYFRGLDDFEPDSPQPEQPAFTSSAGANSMAPDDFATIYDITTLYNSGINGTGLSIAVLGRTDIDVPGYQTFRSLYGLPAATPVMHLVGPDPGLSSSDIGEATLDLEWSGAVARNATIIYVYATSINTAAQEAVDKNLAPIITSSYSSCEPEVADTLRDIAQQANAQGITWMVVSNDSGAAACDKHNDRQLASAGYAISYPASIPEITAVGGTMFNENGGSYWNSSNTATGASVKSYIPETGWNENSGSGIFASGGGMSIFYPKPFWQNAPGVPADGVRDIPDLSMTGASHDGYRTYRNSTNYVSSGTSAATPAFAGVVALLNQYSISKGYQSAPGMGNINPELYRMARTYPAAFHDITTGNNNVPCVQSSPDCLTGSFGYPAGVGYDLISGIGSVDVNNLITHWNQTGAPTSTTVSAASSSLAFGAKAQLTATVKAASGSGIPTGTVTFLIPNGGLGAPVLGSAALNNSGAAAISADPNLLALGNNTVIAVYSGDSSFDVSSGTVSLSVNVPANAAAITASITPNPVYASASTTGVTTWYYTATLTNQSAVPATLTDFTIAGTDEASRLSTFFTNTTIPAHGSLSTSINSTGLNTPVNRVFTFTGTDANGNTWNQQVTVSFIGPILEPEIVLTGTPAAVQQNTSAPASCQWQQNLDVQETGGFSMSLTKFLSGSTDLTSQISQYFGATQIAPFGALHAQVCLGGSTLPAARTYELDAASDGGETFRTVFAATYSAAASAPAALSTATSPIALSLAAASGTATAPLTVTLSGSAAWTASIYPANPTTSWLKLSQASGTGSGAVTLTASAANQAPGVYRATVIVQATNSVPQFIEVPVTFTLGASASTSIGGVTNGASFQVAFAPGMLMSVFGANLSPSTQAASAVPLPLSLAGVSATVNGVAAPLYFVSAGQINLQIPYETGSGPAVVGINNNGALASFNFTVAPSAPGIFVQNGSLVPVSTAKPGDIVVLFMTGEGSVSPSLITGASPSATTAVSQLPAPILPVSVSVGGAPATILFAGIPSALVGVTQVNFVIPSNAASGSQQVVVTSNGQASAPANITIQ